MVYTPKSLWCLWMFFMEFLDSLLGVFKVFPRFPRCFFFWVTFPEYQVFYFSSSSVEFRFDYFLDIVLGYITDYFRRWRRFSFLARESRRYIWFEESFREHVVYLPLWWEL